MSWDIMILNQVQEAAGKVLSQMSNRTNLVDRIYPRQVFAKEDSRALELQGDLTESDLQVLLKFLARDKGAIVYDNEVGLSIYP